MGYLGHSKNDEGQVQTLEEHIEGVFRLVCDILKPLNISEYTLRLAFWLAITHDDGKAQGPFQSHLTGGAERLPHEIYSARCLWDRCVNQGILFEDMQYLIYLVANHHRGLHESMDSLKRRIRTHLRPARRRYSKYDWTELKDALFKEILQEVDAWVLKHKWYRVLPLPPAPQGWDLYHSIRTAQGAFNYGDNVDTARHFGTEPPTPFDRDTLKPLSDTCDAIRIEYQKNEVEKTLLDLRNALFERCSESYLGRFFTISACTGSGKTLAALKLAAMLGASRVVYVLPFLSIVEQVSRFARKVGLCTPLEHVSIPSSEFADKEEKKEPRGNLADWNSPLVITTTERLSQLLVGIKGVDARRFLALFDPDTVVIVDEVQAIPPHKLYAYLRELERLGCKVILMSATLEAGEHILNHAQIPYQMITPPGSLPSIPPRRNFRFSDLEKGKFPNIEEEMKRLGVNAALSIYNTKRLARKAFQKARIPHSYLLTSDLCPKHRLEMLAGIRQLLKDKEPVVVFSTQVIQCGVNISFPLVVRQAAPFSDILQGAGRGNRDGELGALGGHVLIWTWLQVDKDDHLYPDDEYEDRANIFIRKVLKEGCPKDDDEMEAWSAQIVQEEMIQLGVHRECSTVDSYVNGPEIQFEEITNLTHIPKNEKKVQTLVDFPAGKIQDILSGRTSRSEFHLYTVEAPKTKVNREMSVTFPGEKRATKIHVWGRGNPFGSDWESLYSLSLGRYDPPRK